MVTKIWFHRTSRNAPMITLFTEYSDGSVGPQAFEVSEEVYDNWVPDTNHYPGENLKEGIVYDKPLVPNLKTGI